MDKLKLKDLYQLREWVDQMYWDFDRLSSSGQDTLDKIADKLGMETTEDVVDRVKETVKNIKEKNPTWTNAQICSEVFKIG
jgi:TRAP-type C4-dicarboxylate transport system substrate-binding protein